MASYNKTFELGLEDIDLIEGALRGQMAVLTQQGLKGEAGASKEAREIHDLLGRLHDQKIFFRPKSEAYISG